MIKAFLFDYDGVITQGVPDGTLSSRLAEKLNISKTLAREWVTSVLPQLLKGEMSEDEALKIFEGKYGKPLSAEQRDIWFRWAELTPLPIMTELLRKLKAEGYTLGVLSNATTATKDEIRKNGGYDGFDFAVISCEVGSKKPDLEIFEIALRKLPGIQPHEVVFLDDREAAVVTASKLGLQTIVVKDHAKAVADVQALIS